MKRLVIIMLMLIALVTWFVIRTTEKSVQQKANTELVGPNNSTAVLQNI